MNKPAPNIFDKKPKKVSLQPGKSYFYCTCGNSKDGIFCDGSHKGTEFRPKPFEVEEEKDYYLCACKNSQKQPFCDGSHSKL